MTDWTPRRLAAATLSRQFPRLTGRDESAVLALFERIGPVQSQVPRAPYVAAAARLPGVTKATLDGLFENHRLVKASTLRGTVHTSTVDDYRDQRALLDPLVTAATGRLLGLGPGQAEASVAAVAQFCRDQWRTTDEVVAHALDHLGWTEPVGTLAANHLWGHPGLLRRPRNGRWERRTDVLRRAADAVLTLPPVDPGTALRALVRRHLGAYGPATRRDIAWWLGMPLTPVDRAVAALGDELVTTPGPDRDPWLDLAEPPTGDPEPGVRLLAEFDGLLLGYAPPQRDRFVRAELLGLLWSKANGQFVPPVLSGGRVVASWRTTSPEPRTAVEVTMLPGERRLDDGELAAPVAALTAGLALEVTDLVVRAPLG